MKTVFMLALTLLVTACATSPQKLTDKQVEVSSLQSHAFCKGDELRSYVETSSYYQFTCSDGRYFILPKER